MEGNICNNQKFKEKNPEFWYINDKSNFFKKGWKSLSETDW